jgi:hypothetical protein
MAASDLTEGVAPDRGVLEDWLASENGYLRATAKVMLEDHYDEEVELS